MEAEENARRLNDMEHELELDKPFSEYSSRLLSQIADSIISEQQFNEKGNLIGSFKTNRKGMLYRMMLASVLILTTFILTRFSVYSIFLLVVTIVLLSVWLWRCSIKYQMFIDIYDNAIVGKVEFPHERKLRDLKGGIAYYKFAEEQGGNIYITLYDDKVCRLRYMQDAKKIVYLLNRQKGMRKNGKEGQI